jgi:hypothetical protein
VICKLDRCSTHTKKFLRCAFFHKHSCLANYLCAFALERVDTTHSFLHQYLMAISQQDLHWVVLLFVLECVFQFVHSYQPRSICLWRGRGDRQWLGIFSNNLELQRIYMMMRCDLTISEILNPRPSHANVVIGKT